MTERDLRGVKISKIKFTKVGLSVTYSTATGDIIKFDGGNQVHPDLFKAMDMLVPFLTILTEQPEYIVEKDAKGDLFCIEEFGCFPLDNIKITGVQVAGEDGTEGAVISGQRLLKSGKSVNLISPFAGFNDSKFEYGVELSELIYTIVEEAKQYLFFEKWATKQMEFEFNADDVPEFTGDKDL